MILAAAIAVLAALLAGCGSSSSSTTASQQASTPSTTPSTPATTPTTPAASTPTTPAAPPKTTTTQQAPPEEKIALSSTAIDPNGGALQSRYTCDGQDTPLPLKIEGVPPGTKELMLDVIKVKPVNNKLAFAWAVTHINPNTRTITNGKLPPGATTATNSNGQTTYHLCPPKGPTEAYVAVIFALPHTLPAQPAFNPTTLRLQAEHTATYQNLLIFNYTRH